MNISKVAIIILLVFITLIALLIKNGNITGIIRRENLEETSLPDMVGGKESHGILNPTLKITGSTSHNKSVAFNNVVNVATYDTFTGKILTTKRYKKSMGSEI